MWTIIKVTNSWPSENLCFATQHFILVICVCCSSWATFLWPIHGIIPEWLAFCYRAHSQYIGCVLLHQSYMPWYEFKSSSSNQAQNTHIINLSHVLNFLIEANTHNILHKHKRTYAYKTYENGSASLSYLHCDMFKQ